MAIPKLDHIVILLPHADILHPPKWLTDHFTIAPGGRHGDNKTENVLIVFADGSYLELIAFVDDVRPPGHFWGDKGFGIIDFAFTLTEGPDDGFVDIQQQMQKLDIPDAWKPQGLVQGSRLKPDGQKIEWKVSFPQAGARGRVPFWCFDVTPRERRVSVDSKSTTHPSGAKGVANILVYLDGEGEELAFVKKVLDVALPQTEERLDDATWDVDTIHRSEIPCAISIMEPKQAYEKEAVGGGRLLVARLSLFTDAKAGGDDIRRIQKDIHGDQLSIGFVGV